jgi:hypothetical protein
MAWYFKGFPVGGDARRGLATVSSFADLDRWIAELDPSAPFPVAQLNSPRGRQGSPRGKVVLPYGWLDSRLLDDDVDLSAAELDSSGG